MNQTLVKWILKMYLQKIENERMKWKMNVTSHNQLCSSLTVISLGVVICTIL